MIALVCALPTYANELSAARAPEVQGPISQAHISEKTDEELTALTARWGELSASERRTVLREVRNRMRASANASARAKANYVKQLRAQGSTGIVVQRKYGRKSDGSVVVQTRVIQKGAPTTGRVTFGFGFERRAKRQPNGHPQTQSATTLVNGEADDLSQEVPVDQ